MIDAVCATLYIVGIGRDDEIKTGAKFSIDIIRIAVCIVSHYGKMTIELQHPWPGCRLEAY